MEAKRGREFINSLILVVCVSVSDINIVQWYRISSFKFTHNWSTVWISVSEQSSADAFFRSRSFKHADRQMYCMYFWMWEFCFFFSFWFLLCRFYMSRFCSIVASFIIDHTWMCTYAYANQQMANQFWLSANVKSSTSKRWHIYTQIDHQYGKKDNIYLNRFENSSGNLILSNEKLSST